MRERDIHKWIEQQAPDAKRRIWERVSAELGVTAAPVKKAASRNKLRLWAALTAVLVCVVTLSVVLPLTLNKSGEVTYCDSSQYTVESLGSTLKDYSLSHNNGMLYVDWYDGASSVVTDYAHKNDDKGDIVFLKEKIIKSETNETIVFFTADSKMRVDFFESFRDFEKKLTVKNVVVKYDNSDANRFKAWFEYGGRDYYVQLDTDGGQARFVEVIESILK